jgi:hypothetical protein
MYDYENDKYGKECLKQAILCKTDVGFGAVLVKNNKIIGIGRNRHVTAEERKIIPYTDYAIHAEQSAILDALNNDENPDGGEVYVLGLCLHGKNKGTLTTRTERIFVCHKCPHAFIKYNVSVNIPYINGWMNIPAKEALEIGKRVSQKGYWKDFVTQ